MLKKWLEEKGIDHIDLIFNEKFQKKFSAKQKTPGMGSDKQSYQKFCQEYERQKKVIYTKILNGNYTFSPFLLTHIKEIKTKNGNPIIKDGKPEEKIRPIIQASVRDSLFQQVVISYLNEAFPESFYKNSYAYQAEKSPIDAVKEIKKNIKNGFIWTYDADLSNFFGSLNHDILLNLISQYYPEDPELLKIVRRFIKTHFIEVPSFSEDVILKKLKGKIANNSSFCPITGIPQGGILSGFLANIYLHRFDILLSRQSKIKYIRYADDFIIQAKKSEDLETVSNLIQPHLNLLKVRINVDKTKICCESSGKSGSAGFEFLGFRFRDGVVSIKEKNVKKLISTLNTIIIERSENEHGKKVFDIYSILKGEMELLRTHIGPYRSASVRGILLSEAQWESIYCFQYYLEKIDKFFISDPTSERPFEKYCWFDYFYLATDIEQLNYLTFKLALTVREFHRIRFNTECSYSQLRQFGFRSFKNRFFRHKKTLKTRAQENTLARF